MICKFIYYPIASFASSSTDVQLDYLSEPCCQYFHSCNGQIEYCYNAAVKGNSFAQRKLADAYYEGDGVRQDLSYAFKWYSTAAEQNDSISLFRLSEFYSDGLSPAKQNDEMSLYYRLKAGYVDNSDFYALCRNRRLYK